LPVLKKNGVAAAGSALATLSTAVTNGVTVIE
jgi:hypothetical protein